MEQIPQVVSRMELANSFLGDLVQVCAVTRDHRRTLEGMVRLGIGPWTIRTFDASNLTETSYRGAPAAFAMKVCLANSRNMNWEVIEPLAGPSIYEDFLSAQGEGIQHLGFNCAGIEYEQRIRELTRRGYEPVQTGVYMGRVRFHYFGTAADLGTVVEVYSVPSGFVFPEPEAWYPAPPPG